MKQKVYFIYSFNLHDLRIDTYRLDVKNERYSSIQKETLC